MKILYIYGLFDPRTPIDVRYIGITTHLIVTIRIRGHIEEMNIKLKKNIHLNHKDNWIQTLVEQNLKPSYKIIDTFSSIERDWRTVEKFWIKSYKNGGYKLVNSCAGGEGSLEYKHTPKAIEKIANASKGRIFPKRTMSEEEKERRKGWKHTEEWKQKQRERLLGNSNSAGIVAMANATRGKKKSLETLKNMSIAQSNRTKEWQNKLNNSHTGKIASEETKEKQSKAKLGTKYSEERKKVHKEAQILRRQREREEKLKNPLQH